MHALGADASVDYLRPGWPDQLRAQLGDRKVSVVIDGVGGQVGRQAFELLDVGGRQVIFGWTAGEATWVDTVELLGRGLTVTGLGPRLLRRAELVRALERRAG